MQKILLVDDEEDIREIMAMIIESSYEDIELIEASSGNKAIEILSNDPKIDVIFCDFHMADGGGDKVYAFLKEKLQNSIPFILVSTDLPSMFDVFAVHL